MCTNTLFVQEKIISDYQYVTNSQFLVNKLLTSCKRRNNRFSGFLTLHEPRD